jgi:hypothetical protein
VVRSGFVGRPVLVPHDEVVRIVLVSELDPTEAATNSSGPLPLHARTAGAADQDPAALLGRQLAERCGEGLDGIGSVISTLVALVMRKNKAS